MIPYGRHEINQSDIDSVTDVLKSDFLTQGPVVPRFEKTVSDYCNVKYGVAVNSATSALHLACLSLGLSNGDIVWTVPNTFVASANCALYCGASVDFVDIDENTYNLCIKSLSKKLKHAKIFGELPSILIPVHFAGQSCDMESIHSLSRQYGFKIIEDASHAIGGLYKGKPIGNCLYSDITVFSFHPVKIITCGEGGMLLTNNSDLAHKLKLLRTHGITKDFAEMSNDPHGSWYYEQIDLGFNYRMTDIHAALGLSQFKRLNKFVSQRHQIAKYYDDSLLDLPVITPWQHPDNYSAFHLYPIRVDESKTSISRKELFDQLRNSDIGVNIHYIPVHMHPYYQKFGFKEGDFPVSEKFYSSTLTIPLFPSLSEAEQDYVVSALREIL